MREEGNHSREEGWYLLRGLESAMLVSTFGICLLNSSMTSTTAWPFLSDRRCGSVEEECDAARNFLGPKERYPCRQPIHLSNWC